MNIWIFFFYVGYGGSVSITEGIGTSFLISTSDSLMNSHTKITRIVLSFVYVSKTLKKSEEFCSSKLQFAIILWRFRDFGCSYKKIFYL